jgi:Fe-S cluster assembly scaffold protein SufB
MRNVKNAHYLQIDHQIKNIFQVKGVTILSSPEAWRKFSWTRKYFFKKPKEGYFIWIKNQVNFPLFTCISIVHKNVSQELQNLLVIEKNLKISLQGTCNTLKKNLKGNHKAQGKIILKEGSSLKYSHVHSWGEKDIVEPNYEFILGKDSKLDYSYKTLFTPRKLRINNLFNLSAGANCNVKTVANCIQTKAEMKDVLVLKEKGASGIINLRLVGGKDSRVSARSQIIADSESKGHLDCQGLLTDCQGLLTDKESEISLIPELVCKHKLAQITHEASIGRISQEQLNYLRMRGLTEKEATNLIINGFLEI